MNTSKNVSDDPLAALLTNDAKAADRKKLANLLSQYVLIDSQSQELSFTPDFDAVDGNEIKVELMLAGAKARSLLFGAADGLSPSEVAGAGVMPAGSVKTALKRLFDGRKIGKDKNGRYFLPAYRVSDLAARVSKEKSSS
jgi:hypothetical protein